MLTGEELQKVCPRCETAHPLTAAACARCGRRFRTPLGAADVTLQMPVALLAGVVAERPAPPRKAETPEATPAAPPPATARAPIRLARPQPLAPTSEAPPEVRHRAALDECARRFVGLAWGYALAVVAAPTLAAPALLLWALRRAEAGLRAEVAGLGVDDAAWAAPLRRRRLPRIAAACAQALAALVVLLLVVFVLHKTLDTIYRQMDPLTPDVDGSGRSSYSGG